MNGYTHRYIENWYIFVKGGNYTRQLRLECKKWVCVGFQWHQIAVRRPAGEKSPGKKGSCIEFTLN